MNFRDQWVTNDDGERFVFTVAMQRQLHEADLPVEPESLSQLPGVANSKVAVANTSPPPKPSVQTEKEDSFPINETDADEDSDIEPEMIQIDPETGKYLGRLKWYNDARGYGFIARGGGQDIFFHRSDTLVDPTQLAEGQWLLYDVEETERGFEASEVEAYEGELAL